MKSSSQHNKKLNITSNPFYQILSINLSKVKFEPLFNEEIVITDKNSVTLDNAQIGHSYKIDKSEKIFIDVHLLFKTNIKYENKLLYDVEIIYSAKVQCDKSEKVLPKPDDFALINAPTHLYPYIRNYFHHLLILSGLPPIILPPIIIRKK